MLAISQISLPAPRPLLLILIAYGMGVLLFPLYPLPLATLILLSLLFLIPAIVLPSRLSRLRNSLLLLLFVSLGAARTQQVSTPLPDDVLYRVGGASVWVHGTVDSPVDVRPDGSFSFVLKVEAVDDYVTVTPQTGRMQITGREAVPPGYGDRLHLRGRIETPPTATNPNGFDYHAYLSRRGIYTTMRVRHASDLRTMSIGGNPLSRAVIRLRHHLQAINEAYLPAEDAALLNGMLFGVRRPPTDVDDAFSRTGTTHLIFTSGLHVALVAALCLVFFRTLTLPRLWAHAVTILFIIGYVLIAGSSPAVSRSDLMFILLLAAPFVRRHTAPLHTLTGAALLLLLNPLTIYDPGTQISFITVWMILLWMPVAEELLWKWEPGMPFSRRLVRAVFLGFIVGNIAFLASAPLIAFYFNLFTPVAPIANLILAPLAELLLLLGLLASALNWLPAPLTDPLWAALHLGIRSLVRAAFFFADLPGAWASVESLPVIGIVFYYLILGGLGAIIRKNLKKPRVILPPSADRDTT